MLGFCQSLRVATKRDHKEFEKRRLKAAKMFEKGNSAPEVAKSLGVARQVAYRWKAAWVSAGHGGLLSKGRAGRKSRMCAEDTAKVAQALLAGPRSEGYKTDLWTLPRVALLIKKLTGLKYHPGHVWRLLGKLGFSCQRPERRAIERDEEAIAAWKKKTWPSIKKKPAAKGESLYSSTKVG